MTKCKDCGVKMNVPKSFADKCYDCENKTDNKIVCPYCKSNNYTIQMLVNSKPHYCVCNSDECRGRIF